jgi:hypothetical protein
VNFVTFRCSTDLLRRVAPSVADLAMVALTTPQLPLLLRVVRDGSPSFIAVTGSDER